MIYDHTYEPWKREHNKFIKRNSGNQYNGAYYYSQEIVKNIIPKIKTDRDWWTINIDDHMTNHSIVFVHQNSDPETMKWVAEYDDVILVCSLPETAEALKECGHTIYVPLSVDIDEVKRYRGAKTKDTAYIGRIQRLKEWDCEELPEGIDYIYGLPRDKFLHEVAKYKTVYASGRAAIEAQILGCEVKQYVKPLIDTYFDIIDNSEAAAILQNEIDKVERGTMKIKSIDHRHPAYRRKWQICGNAKYNGAFFYSQEIVKNIIPLIDTDRNWITVNVKGYGYDHAIVFVHNNLHPENYEWLSKYNDLVFVCGIPETMDKVKHLGKVIYVPISVDVEDIKRYAVKEKTNDTCYAGRKAKRRMVDIPDGVTMLEGIPREKLLAELATYHKVYAVGRTAIEAKILGCEILPCDPRFPDPDRWEILDNKDAAKILQEELDKIDKPEDRREEEKTIDLNKMTKAQLIDYAADELGIEISDRLKKADIIETIEEANG